MTDETTSETVFYGACGMPNCADCRPLFDLENRVIEGTEE